MSRQENSTSNNSQVVQNSEASTARRIVTTEQMFIPNQPAYRTNEYEPPPFHRGR